MNIDTKILNKIFANGFQNTLKYIHHDQVEFILGKQWLVNMPSKTMMHQHAIESTNVSTCHQKNDRLVRHQKQWLINMPSKTMMDQHAIKNNDGSACHQKQWWVNMPSKTTMGQYDIKNNNGSTCH